MLYNASTPFTNMECILNDAKCNLNKPVVHCLCHYHQHYRFWVHIICNLGSLNMSIIWTILTCIRLWYVRILLARLLDIQLHLVQCAGFGSLHHAFAPVWYATVARWYQTFSSVIVVLILAVYTGHSFLISQAAPDIQCWLWQPWQHIHFRYVLLVLRACTRHSFPGFWWCW
jgi:hypothetical protein